MFIATTVPHVQARVNNWLHPFNGEICAATAPRGTHCPSDQIAQSIYGFATGGIFGKGLDQGRPWLVGFAKNADFILVTVGEELGMVGLFALMMVYTLFVMRGFKTALLIRDNYGKLLAAGLAVDLRAAGVHHRRRCHAGHPADRSADAVPGRRRFGAGGELGRGRAADPAFGRRAASAAAGHPADRRRTAARCGWPPRPADAVQRGSGAAAQRPAGVRADPVIQRVIRPARAPESAWAQPGHAALGATGLGQNGLGRAGPAARTSPAPPGASDPTEPMPTAVRRVRRRTAGRFGDPTQAVPSQPRGYGEHTMLRAAEPTQAMPATSGRRPEPEEGPTESYNPAFEDDAA